MSLSTLKDGSGAHLLEREDKGFPPLTCAQTSTELQKISREELKKREARGQETPRSTLIICKYDSDGSPKMVKLIIDKGDVTVGVTPEKWAIGGKATEQTCAKIYKYLADNLKDDEDEKNSFREGCPYC
ncbi:hypothetical protein C5167_011545 [Papaver somniferum]|uniref:Uncharacterized protein n=1 Tax=Papaver somniferum TaxID=3469 RepID=A0A4Y7K3E5_PAPSO|nr:hypothetical protein C5167_011545 [Papaver somniferum]